MLDIRVHEGQIVNVSLDALHGYEILCPKCFKQHYDSRGSGGVDEFYDLIGKNESNITFQLRCGCVMSVDDLRYKLILIDEWIANSVSRINIAGYRTNFCCSGHSVGYSGYLSFVKYYEVLADFVESDQFLHRFLNTEIMRVENDDGTFTNRLCLRLKPVRNKSKFEKLQLFRKLLKRVAKWCEENKLTKE